MSWRAIRLVGGWVLALAALGFLATHLLDNVDQLRASAYRPGWRSVLAIPCVLLGHFLAGNVTFLCLRILSAAASWQAVLRIHFISQVAKYLPMGGMLNVAAQGVGYGSLKQVGVHRALLAVSMMLAVVCAGAAAWVAFGVSADPAKPWWAGLLGVAGLMALVAALRRARWLQALHRILSRMSRRIDREQSVPVRPSTRLSIAVVGLASAIWLAYGSSLILVSAEVVPLDPRLCLQLVGVMAAGWLVGFLSILAPAGLGVREVTMMVLLQGILSEPWPSVLPVVLRVLWAAGDLVGFALANVLHRLPCGRPAADL